MRAPFTDATVYLILAGFLPQAVRLARVAELLELTTRAEKMRLRAVLARLKKTGLVTIDPAPASGFAAHGGATHNLYRAILVWDGDRS